jgi:hypothetical protein
MQICALGHILDSPEQRIRFFCYARVILFRVFTQSGSQPEAAASSRMSATASSGHGPTPRCWRQHQAIPSRRDASSYRGTPFVLRPRFGRPGGAFPPWRIFRCRRRRGPACYCAPAFAQARAEAHFAGTFSRLSRTKAPSGYLSPFRDF